MKIRLTSLNVNQVGINNVSNTQQREKALMIMKRKSITIGIESFAYSGLRFIFKVALVFLSTFSAKKKARWSLVNAPDYNIDRLLNRTLINPWGHRSFPEDFAKYRFGYDNPSSKAMDG
ncbi:hypothetical protein [Pseudomonas syringae group sp. J309-1]|uniref:hypothetical protein n=1 Tax=Pseudomonas syringae group sp. J309-1 TaxID=3079588 RepID=UPI00291481BB|nr:hypothetical protein [Pseudomonas syringae group sp. J309-1]MDU8362435.1 hypothetical protein [Pseudomonas syringae group sp. J309-1]